MDFISCILWVQAQASIHDTQIAGLKVVWLEVSILSAFTLK